ncbi:MAG: SDR family oxidoreductase [Myxococcales bacterium]|nr:MAG: SDR family oxidoreductase [Myxococcales bacterium]
MSGFLNKSFIITGAAGGIGSQLSLELAKQGACLTLIDLGTDRYGDRPNPSAVQALARQINKTGGRAVAHAYDVCDERLRHEAFSQNQAHFGTTDGVIFCAGIAQERNVAHLQSSHLDAMLRVNLRAPIDWTLAYLEHCKSHEQQGKVVLLTSSVFWRGPTNESHGCAAAAGLNAFVRSAAPGLARHGVLLNAIAPTAYTPAMAEHPNPALRPSQNLSTASVARAILFFLSDAAAEINGEILGVTGNRLYGFRMLQNKGVLCREEGLADEQYSAKVFDALNSSA